jgi:hypothetical protein
MIASRYMVIYKKRNNKNHNDAVAIVNRLMLYPWK